MRYVNDIKSVGQLLVRENEISLPNELSRNETC